MPVTHQYQVITMRHCISGIPQNGFGKPLALDQESHQYLRVPKAVSRRTSS